VILNKIKSDESENLNNLSIFEAMMNEVLNFDELEILDLESGEMCTMFESVEKGLVDLETAEKLISCMEPLSFEELIENGIYDMKENIFPESISTENAIKNGIIEPELVFFSLPKENKIINVSKMIENGMLNPINNEIEIVNENAEKVFMKLNDAINNESAMLSSSVNSEEMKRKLPRKLKDLLLNSIIDRKNDMIVFEEVEIENVSVNDALNNNLLCEEALVKLKEQDKDDQIQEMIYCGNSDIVKLIKDLNELLDAFTQYLSNLKENDNEDWLSIDVILHMNDYTLNNIEIHFRN